jgi:tetratricopeptide (TPR) repeat protein
LEPEIASLLTNLAGEVLSDAWSAVRPRLAALLRLRGGDGDARVLGDLEDARAASAAGSPAEALARVEAALRETLGTLAAEQTSLAAEVRELLAASRDARARRLPRIPVSAVSDFENHEAELRGMDAAWEAGRGAAGPTLLFLYGPRGIGLTTLARHWLLRHRDTFGAGPQLSAVLARDADGAPPDPAAVLDTWFRLLHVPVEEVPSELAAKVAKFQQLTAEGPVFVLLEDVALASLARHLLPGSSLGVVVVTGRELMRSLVSDLHAAAFKVGPLLPEYSRRLLISSGRLAPYATSHEAEIDKAVSVCEGNPLLVRIAGAQMRFDQPYGIGEFATALSDRRPGIRLGAFDVDERSGAEIFDAGYRELCRRHPEAAEVYRYLGLHPTAEFDEDVVAAMAPDLGGRTRAKALRTLRDSSLVERVDGGMYRVISGLVHAHAAERARADLPAAEREAARRRCVGYYVDLAERTDAGLSPRYRHDPPGAYARYEPLAAEAQDVLVEALTRRREVLRAAVRAAYEAGARDPWFYDATCRLAQGLWTFYLRCGFHSDWIEVYDLGCRAALESLERGDLLMLARMQYGLGFAHLDRSGPGDPEAARGAFEQALELVGPALARPETPAGEAEGWRRTWSSVLEGLGKLEDGLGRPEQALARFDAALAALEGVDHPRGRALIALHRGPVLGRLGRYADAEAVLVTARQEFLAPPRPDRFNAAKASARLAEVLVAAGRAEEALAAFATAVAGLGGPRHGYQRAAVLLSRGDLLHARGEAGRARGDWAEAAELFRAANSARAAEAEQRLAGHPGPGPSRGQGEGPDGG